MTLNELIQEIDQISREQGTRPYYSFSLQVNEGGAPTKESIGYSCYMLPHHAKHDQYPTPEALLRALRGEESGLASLNVDGDLSELA